MFAYFICYYLSFHGEMINYYKLVPKVLSLSRGRKIEDPGNEVAITNSIVNAKIVKELSLNGFFKLTRLEIYTTINL